MAPGTLCALLLSSLASAAMASRVEAMDPADELCAPDVMLGACRALGVPDIGADLASGRVAALLALSVDEVESMLEALGATGQPMTVQTLCHAAVGGIESVLHETPPKAQGSACIDAACEGPGVDVSLEAMLKDPPEILPHAGGDDDIVVVEGAPGTDGAEGADAAEAPISVADSTRLLLHVAFGIFPAPNEAESGDDSGSEHGSNTSLAQLPPTFGNQVLKERYGEYRRHVQLAAAWAAAAVRKMEPPTVCKWFGADKTAEVRRVLTRALVALDNVHIRKNPEGFCDRQQSVAAFVSSYKSCTSEYAAEVMAGRAHKGCGVMENGRYQVNFCETFWRADPVFRTGTILHEMIHHFGVKDKSYNYGEIRYELSTLSNLNNADTYAFFAADVNGQTNYRNKDYSDHAETCQVRDTRVREGDRVRSLFDLSHWRPPVKKGDIGTVDEVGKGRLRGKMFVTFHGSTKGYVAEDDLVRVTGTLQRGDRVRSLVDRLHWRPAPLRRGQVGIVVDIEPAAGRTEVLVEFGHVSGWVRKEDLAEVADLKPGDAVRSLVSEPGWTPKPLRRGDRGTVVKVEPRDGGGGKAVVNFGHTKGWLHMENVIKDAGDATSTITTVDPPMFKQGDTVRSLVAHDDWKPKPVKTGDVGRVDKEEAGDGGGLVQVDFGHAQGWAHVENVIRVTPSSKEGRGTSTIGNILSWLTLGFINVRSD